MWHIYDHKQYTLFFSPAQEPLRNPSKYAILLRKNQDAAERENEVIMGQFDHLNVAFFTKAAIYPGSIGTFRYRFQREGWTDGKGTLTVWVYENTSFELAKDVESQTFPWTEEGVEQVKAWLEEKLAERGSQLYSIPYPAPKAE